MSTKNPPQMAIKRCFTLPFFMSILSLTTILLVLARQKDSTLIPSPILNTGSLFGWGAKEEEKVKEARVRMVVFGDSWVDDRPESGMSGRGKSWVRVACEEIDCTSYLNYASSQPVDEYPANPPKGALTKNKIHIASHEDKKHSHVSYAPLNLLPDLGEQIQSYIAENPPSETPVETIFCVSHGFWDVYNLASLDLERAIIATDASVKELFHQLDILYAHHAKSYLHSNTKVENTNPPLFPVIIPHLLDPSLLPGWKTHRPVPISPSTMAEQQRNALSLTTRWNIGMENRMLSWLKEMPTFYRNEIEKTVHPIIDTENHESRNATNEAVTVIKDIFYFDLAQKVLDILAEHQMQVAGISDARGRGTKPSPYKNINQACLRESADEEDNEADFLELNGHLLCKYPEEYLYWDAFNIGSRAKENIGKELSKMIKVGDSLRRQFNERSSNSVGSI
ncbi:hypothetical protein HYFRA_00006461 [Hymenoscyphus fraxineus]|uniref:Uncharacterized protein n=1 Tax=Hymenoscyphus fraxineus TaxID=746836 RepID=A0A9N9KQ66_9HELO|nr:hypothetical protein HYFRA_00006461 [Hymenoscyphus fraxineus]